ncbi:unnamed protein product [Zymoseptoria tritici ST99CH_1E4]|uniref:Uncharacterized protein n=1 Tax=Zymoseptoria tritici ST99CH_1E4 TaxID=1276532 RepID=A0A2H1FJF3_ZYMTR|nr:unnamed protein product [Zymoseptoria tritici ST99CH_1E4]
MKSSLGDRGIEKPLFWNLAYGSAVLFSMALVYSLLPHTLLASEFIPTSSLDTPTQIPSTDTTTPTLPSNTPLCDVWSNYDSTWRRQMPLAVPANDSALPQTRLGDPEIMNRNGTHGCVPAAERLGPFGHSVGRSDFRDRPWSTLRWGELQSKCAYEQQQQSDGKGKPYRAMKSRLQRFHGGVDENLKNAWLDGKVTGRTAVVLRTWNQFEYTGNQKAWLRTLATELALDTGGKYQLFLLVDVKDGELDLNDDKTHAEVLEKSVPEEFRDMTLLWNEKMVKEWFPKVDQHRAMHQMYQALQIFSYTFPEFDHIWQFEMDARLTGNAARTLDDVTTWSTSQPRKNLWERNARFYVPGLWSDYSAFSRALDAELANHTDSTTWGPPPTAQNYITPGGPPPPSRSNTTWGIGEAPDLITFSPMIDPIGSDWAYEEGGVHGFDPPASLPRRMAIVSMTRTSRRLLRLISLEQRETGNWLVSESTPETFTFLHGLKGVYAPHVVSFSFDDGKGKGLETEEMEEMVHKGPWWSRAGGARTGFLWTHGGLPEERWKGASYFFWEGTAGNVWKGYVGGECGEAMLLHPVKGDD